MSQHVVIDRRGQNVPEETAPSPEPYVPVTPAGCDRLPPGCLPLNPPYDGRNPFAAHNDRIRAQWNEKARLKRLAEEREARLAEEREMRTPAYLLTELHDLLEKAKACQAQLDQKSKAVEAKHSALYGLKQRQAARGKMPKIPGANFDVFMRAGRQFLKARKVHSETGRDRALAWSRVDESGSKPEIEAMIAHTTRAAGTARRYGPNPKPNRPSALLDTSSPGRL
jgi:hypothetical protein